MNALDLEDMDLSLASPRQLRAGEVEFDESKTQQQPLMPLQPPTVDLRAVQPLASPHIQLAQHSNLREVKQTSNFRGVHFHRKSGKWRAQIQLKGKRVSIGSYETDFLAAQAYDKKAREAHGARAKLNFPLSSEEGTSAASVSSSSRFRGVCMTKQDQKWLSQVSLKNAC